MKKIVLLLCFSMLFSRVPSAQTIDLLSGDLTMPTQEEPKKEDPQRTEQHSTISDEIDLSKDDGGSFFSFITKPITKLFSADEEVVDSDGKKETF